VVKNPQKRTKGRAALLSMTGFGKGRAAKGSLWVEAEIKAVNHRYLDLAFKLPRLYSPFEHELRNMVSERLERGRVEIFVLRGGDAKSPVGQVVFNEKLYTSYLKAYSKVLPAALAKAPEVQSRMALDILNRTDVLSSDEEAQEAVEERPLLFQAMEHALGALQLMREAEGEKLARDIEGRFSNLVVLQKAISERAGELAPIVKERLVGRLKKLASELPIDEARVASEVVFLTDRMDVTEETVRLSSHLSQFEKTLGAPPNGRKLDFILQEIGREINTIGSKIQDAPVQSLVVEAKVEMEKIREQLQNLA
jgi:uncharacterized protein (TIGR00255 family)